MSTDLAGAVVPAAPLRRRRPRVRVRYVLLVLACVADLVTALLSANQRSTTLDVAAVVGTVTDAVLPSDFLGVSFEELELANPNLDSPSFVALLKNLGPGTLRLAGNAADRYITWDKTGTTHQTEITPDDLQTLKRLLEQTGWRADIGVPLGPDDPTNAASLAKAAQETLGDSLRSIQIGNEPDLYTGGSKALRPSDYDVNAYLAQVSTFEKAFASAGVTAGISGPDTATGKWLSEYGQSPPANLVALTRHFYPLGCQSGGKNNPARLLPDLLSASATESAGVAIKKGLDAADAAKVPLILDETNSTSCSGRTNRLSNTLGATLWALDFLLQAARAGVQGVYFHGGLDGCTTFSPVCATNSANNKAGQYTGNAVYYAMAMVKLMGTGRFVELSGGASDPNVHQYAVQQADGSIKVLVINSGDSEVKFSLRDPGHSVSGVDTVELTGPRVGSRTGIALGGQAVADDGELAAPRLQPLSLSGPSIDLTVPSGSAVLATLT